MKNNERSYDMTTNLSDLPYTLFSQLAQHFDSSNMWQKIFSNGKDSVYYLRFFIYFIKKDTRITINFCL